MSILWIIVGSSFLVLVLVITFLTIVLVVVTILPLGSFFSTTETLLLYWCVLKFSLLEFEKE